MKQGIKKIVILNMKIPLYKRDLYFSLFRRDDSFVNLFLEIHLCSRCFHVGIGIFQFEIRCYKKTKKTFQ